MNSLKRAVYPGSFDPVTVGHLDLIRRATRICDELTIGVLVNSAKQPMFSVEDRIAMLEEVCRDLRGVFVVSYDGLSVDFVRDMNADFMVRGLRTAADFEYELPFAQANVRMEEKADTVFLATAPEHSYISSSAVRELLRYHADIKEYVPDSVYHYLQRKGCL